MAVVLDEQTGHLDLLERRPKDALDVLERLGRPEELLPQLVQRNAGQGRVHRAARAGEPLDNCAGDLRRRPTDQIGETELAQRCGEAGLSDARREATEVLADTADRAPDAARPAAASPWSVTSATSASLAPTRAAAQSCHGRSPAVRADVGGEQLRRREGRRRSGAIGGQGRDRLWERRQGR